MQNQFSLSVNRPCSEKWNQFKPTPNGGFCTSCSKNVIDFTRMSDTEIIDFFKNKPTHTCGRFRRDQLRMYIKTNTISYPGRKWLPASLLSLLMLITSKESQATPQAEKAKTEMFLGQNEHIEKATSTSQKHTIKGTVRDERNEPLPGVNILLKGTTVGTVSDLEGRFQFPHELTEGDVLIVSYIGFISVEYKVPKNAPAEIEIPMLMLYEDLMGDVAINEVYHEKSPYSSSLWQKIKRIF